MGEKLLQSPKASFPNLVISSPRIHNCLVGGLIPWCDRNSFLRGQSEDQFENVPQHVWTGVNHTDIAKVPVAQKENGGWTIVLEFY